MPLGTDKVSGKVVRSDDPRARKPAAGHGHARTRRAGCSDVARSSCCICRLGRGQNATATALTEYVVAVEPYSVRIYYRSFFALLAGAGAGTSWNCVKGLLAGVCGAAWSSGVPCVG